MKKQVRRGVFETNSSATHSLTLYKKEEWEKIKNGEGVIDESWFPGKNEKFKTKEEYDELLSKRIDKLSSKAAQELIWTLVSNSGDDEEIEAKERAYRRLNPIYKQTTEETLRSMCEFFENPENYRHNTFSMRMALCDGDEKCYEDIPELVEIANLLKELKCNLLENN